MLLATLGAACSQVRNSPCPRSEPAFRLELTAVDGPLPADTDLVVNYQGSLTQDFNLTTKGAGNADVCCRIESTRAGSGPLPAVSCGSPLADDGGPVVGFLCQLWTNGSAEVIVTASSYARLDDQ